jgi:diazepam-binding inhibitor (GABA receptor modulating acyl-CoA-binding protein)
MRTIIAELPSASSTSLNSQRGRAGLSASLASSATNFCNWCLPQGAGSNEWRTWMIDVEVRVIDPPRTVGVLHRDLLEAAVAQQASGDGTFEALGVDPAGEDHHADDLHQVLGPVHAQPGGVDVGNSFARSHRLCSPGKWQARTKWQAHIIASHFIRSSTGGISVSDLQSQFEDAVASSKDLAERPDNATLLQLYALYKQASDGDVEGRRPGFTDMVGRAKYDAWAAIKGTAPAAAMTRYVALIERLKAH